jgi:hypothetical protein
MMLVVLGILDVGANEFQRGGNRTFLVHGLAPLRIVWMNAE